MTLTCIITARSGSVRYPNKNFMPFYDNKSLTEIAIDQAKSLSRVKNIILTTDNIEFNSKVRNKDNDILVIDRSPALSVSSTTTRELILDTLEEIDSKETTHILLLQPTSPIRDATFLNRAIDYFFNAEIPLLVSVTKPVINPKDIVSVSASGKLSYPLINKHDSYYFETGQFYIFSVQQLLSYQDPFTPTTEKQIYLADPLTFVDIDFEFQFKLAKLMYSKYLSI